MSDGINLRQGDLNVNGKINLSTLGTGTSVTNLGVDSSGNVVSGTTGGSGGGSGGGNVSNTATPLNDQLAVWTNATTIEGNSQLIYQSSTLQVKNGSGKSSNLYNYGRLIMGDTTTQIDIEASYGNANHSGILVKEGSGLFLGVKNQTSMYFDSGGNVSIGHNKAVGTTHSARLEITGEGNDSSKSSLIIRDFDDPYTSTIFEVKNDGTVVIPNVGSTTPVTNLGVDASGNVVSGTTGSGSGGSVLYGTTSQIPFINASSNGFEYTNSTNAGYNGRFEWQNEMLEVNSGFGTSVPSASIGNLTASDYTARFRKSYTYSQPYTSLGIRRDGTVEIGQYNQPNYQNVLSFHQMTDTAITAMKDDQYFNKLYVNNLSELRYRTSGGIESILNLLFAADGEPGMQKRVQVRGSTSDNKRHNFEIVSGSNANANDWGTKLKTQKANLIVSYPSNIGSDTYNTTLNSTSILGGTMDVATYTSVSSSVIGGYNHDVDGGNYHTVFGSGNNVYNENRGTNSADSSNNAVLIGSSNYATGDQLVGIGHGIKLLANGTAGHRIDESAGFGHKLSIYNNHSYAIGNGHYGGYIPDNVASITFNLTGVVHGGGAPTAGFFNFRTGTDHDDTIIGEPVNFSMGSTGSFRGVIEKETNGSPGDSIGRGVFWLSSANSTVAPNVKPTDAVGTYASNRAGTTSSMGKMIYAEQGNTWIGDRIGINVHDDPTFTTYLTTEEDIDASLHIFTESDLSTDNAILVEGYVSGSANNFKYKVRNDGVVVYPQFDKSNLPTGEVGSQIWVTNDTGGACMAVYNGSNWVRIYDNVTIS